MVTYYRAFVNHDPIFLYDIAQLQLELPERTFYEMSPAPLKPERVESLCDQ